jgi:hypothetical protein
MEISSMMRISMDRITSGSISGRTAPLVMISGGSLNMECIVCPSTFIAAIPVGATTAVECWGLDLIKDRKVDFPVPAPPWIMCIRYSGDVRSESTCFISWVRTCSGGLSPVPGLGASDTEGLLCLHRDALMGSVYRLKPVKSKVMFGKRAPGRTVRVWHRCGRYQWCK